MRLWWIMNMNKNAPQGLFLSVYSSMHLNKLNFSYEEECHGYGYHQECEKVNTNTVWTLL